MNFFGPDEHEPSAAELALGSTTKPDDERLQLFRRILRTAGGPYARRGWKQTQTGLLLRSGDGCWGQIVFYPPRLHADLLSYELYAGALSPYLMRHVNRVDPDRAPNAALVAAHAQLVWAYRVQFVAEDVEGLEPMNRLRLGMAIPPFDPGVLTPSTAPGWLEDVFETVVPLVEEVASEPAIRRWLLRAGGSWNLRMAALLTRHLGLDDLDGVLQRAERASEEEHEVLRAKGYEPKYRDRSTLYPQDWSHHRFVRFLEETPP